MRVRSMFSGVLGFGLVSIPVEVYKAVDAGGIPMHWIHRACGGRVRYQKTCPTCGGPVPQDELARGVEMPDGRLVVLDDDVTDEPPEQDRTLALQSFHPLEDLDPIYFDQPYWLRPGKGGAKPYRLLWDALQAAGQVGVLTMRWRSRPRLGVLRPYGGGTLLLHSMHYP